MTPLPRTFNDRDEFIRFLRAEFPAPAALDANVSVTPGGRGAAIALIDSIDPRAYASTRNHTDGAVTRLSPYLRHGVIDLADLRDAILRRFGRDRAGRLLNELAWRDYFQRVYELIGDHVWNNLEPYKTGRLSGDYAAQLPADISLARTGLACIDAFVTDLKQNGYLHNHARLWFASYVVHFRQVDWRAGARFFLSHLLDGDPASNNLSWQWVASTFSNKPYFFNRENLERSTSGAYCATCPERGRCPMEGSYEELAERLFRPTRESDDTPRETDDRARESDDAPRVSLKVLNESPSDAARTSPRPAVRWVHDDALHIEPSQPDTRAVYIFDDQRLHHLGWSLKRVAFVYECLLDLPDVDIVRGNTFDVLQTLGRSTGRVVTVRSPDPFIKATISALRQDGIDVTVTPPRPFANPRLPLDLGRFSRYWKRAEKSVMSVTGA